MNKDCVIFFHREKENKRTKKVQTVKEVKPFFSTKNVKTLEWTLYTAGTQRNAKGVFFGN